MVIMMTRHFVIALALILSLASLPARALTYKAWNNGLSIENVSDGYAAAPGEVVFDHFPNANDLSTAFSGYGAVSIAAENTRQAAAQFNAAINAGLSVSSSTAPALNGLYGLDSETQRNITAEVVSINTNSAFTNGGGTRGWPDMAGTYHTFTVAQFKNFATVVAQYIDALHLAEQGLATGQAPNWPSSSATIP